MMEIAVSFDENGDGQCELEGYLLGDSLDILESVQVEKPRGRILHLVTSPLEGGELLRKLRSDPQMKGIPVVILTR